MLDWEIKAVVGLVIVTAMAFGGRYIYDKGWDAKASADMVAQAKVNKVAQDKYNTITQQLTDAKGKTTIVYQTITKYKDKIVDRPVYQNVCLDSDGVNTINQALSGELSEGGK